MTNLERRLRLIEDQITAAADRAGRDPAAITLIGVTKTWPVNTLTQAFRAGIAHFGENRTQELAAKRPAFEKLMPTGDRPTWHFIGHLQSRQSQVVADQADYFHAADRLKILRRLANQLAENDRGLKVFLEVNISGEASKEGFAAGSWEKDAQQVHPIMEALEFMASSGSITSVGLMTMAPWLAPATDIRLIFARTRRLRDHLQQVTGRPLPLLSMGMTDDFQIAIEEGATHIRVGRALFGERN